MSYDANMALTTQVSGSSTSPANDQTDDDAYVAFATRIVRGLARRAGHNLDTLSALSMVADMADALLSDAVLELRSDPSAPASWADIGRALGVTRQAAQQRFLHRGDGVRRAGGQPGGLR